MNSTNIISGRRLKIDTIIGAHPQLNKADIVNRQFAFSKEITEVIFQTGFFYCRFRHF